jgi:hypothetical protein
MMYLLLALGSDIIIKQTRRGSSAESVSNEELSSWFINQTKIEPLKLEPHSLNPRRATGNRLVQQTDQRLVVSFDYGMLTVYILPKSEEPELDSQQLLLNLTISPLRWC